MITALAFRIHSRHAEVFRKWLMKRACAKPPFLLVELCDERKVGLN
jgi:hypothetical protein